MPETEYLTERVTMGPLKCNFDTIKFHSKHVPSGLASGQKEKISMI